MLLRNSISNTKKFFRKTLQSFKSFFSTGYHRLPKIPPHDHFPYSAPTLMHLDNNQSHKELEEFNTEQWDSEKETAERRGKEKEVYVGNPVHKKKQMEKREEYGIKNSKRNMISHQNGSHQDSSLSSMGAREERNCVVERKLRELEMLDMGNVDYVLDIEEVLHYYSRLTCPAYLEIVDNFFMQIYSEFFAPISKFTLSND